MLNSTPSIHKKDYQVIALLTLFVLLATLLPSKIALIGTTVIFAAYALVKPFQSLLFLIIYVSIRPFLTEINPGLKFIGDLITFILLIRLLIETKFNVKVLFTFKWFELAYFSFLAFGSIVAYLNGVGLSAIVFQLRTFLIMYLIYYYLARTQLPKNFKLSLAYTAVGLGWLLAVHGIIEKISIRQLFLPEYWKYMPLSAENFSRIYGLTGNPNTLALLMMFAIIAVLFIAYELKLTRLTKFLGVSFILFIGILILTFSRGTLISAIVLGLTYVIITKKFKLIKSLAIGFILSLLFVYVPVNAGVWAVKSLGVEAPDGSSIGSISDRFGQTFDEKNIERMTSNGRIFYIKKGFEIFKDHPITGTGFGTFGGAATIAYGSPIYEEYGIDLSIYFENKIYSDNQYIQVITETGAIGVLLFAAFLLTMLAVFIKDYKRYKNSFSAFMIALWLSTGVSGMYYNIWELKSYDLIFFVLLAVYIKERDTFQRQTRL